MSVSVGIVGAGKIVEDSHLPTLLNLPQVRIAWISDVAEHRATLLSSMYGVRQIPPAAVGDELHGTDVCLLAVPVGARRVYMERCAAVGAAVYAEKPFAINSTEHAYYLSLFPPSRLAIGFQRRFYETTQAVRALLDAALLGPLESIEFTFGAYNLKTGGAGSYVADPAMSGGGMIIESAIHALDQIVYSTQARDVRVTSAQSVVFDRADFDTVTEATLLLAERSVPVRCEITRLRNLPSHITYKFRDAAVRQPLDAESDLVLRDNDHRATAAFSLIAKQGVGATRARSASQAMLLIWDEFLRGLQTHEVNASSAVTSVVTTSWVDQIYAKVAA